MDADHTVTKKGERRVEGRKGAEGRRFTTKDVCIAAGSLPENSRGK